MNHTPIYWFLLGFLSSEATDAAALAAFLVTLFIVIRHYPHKIWQCQRRRPQGRRRWRLRLW